MRFLISIILAFSFGLSASAAEPFQVATGEMKAYWQKYVGAVSTTKNFCTGTLVAADLVLTGAHCLWDVEQQGNTYVSAREVPASEVSFSLFLNGEFHPVKVKKIHISPKYPKDSAHDWAFIRLQSKYSYESYPKVSAPISFADANLLKLKWVGYPKLAVPSAEEMRKLKVSKEYCQIKNYTVEDYWYTNPGYLDIMGHTEFDYDIIGALSCKSRNGLSGGPIVDLESNSILSIHFNRIKTDYGQDYFYSNVLNLVLESSSFYEKYKSLTK